MAQITRKTSHIDETLETIHALERLDLLYNMEKSVGALGGDVWTFVIDVPAEEPADEQEENVDPLMLREAEQTMRKEFGDQGMSRVLHSAEEVCSNPRCPLCKTQ